MTALFYLTRREFGKIPGSLMLIRCLSCETGATFVSKVALILKTVRILRLVRQDTSPKTLLIGLITRRSQVQVLSPQPENRRFYVKSAVFPSKKLRAIFSDAYLMLIFRFASRR